MSWNGEGADARRMQQLREFGSLDYDDEARVLRKRMESSLERSVALGLESGEKLREHRRRSRLLDQIAAVDRQVHDLQSQGDDSGEGLPTDLDRLRARRAALCEQLERPPVWPRVMRGLVTQGFLYVLWLPVTLLVWAVFRGAWQHGHVLLITVTLTCILMPSLRLVCRMWLERLTRPSIASTPGLTDETTY